MSEKKEMGGEYEKKLASTLRSIGDAVITIDLDGRIKFLNPVAESLLGWTFDVALGEMLSRVFILKNSESGDLLTPPIDLVFKELKPHGLQKDTLLISKNNSQCFISANFAPIFLDEQKLGGIIVIFRDITRFRMLEIDLQKTLRQLLEAHEKLKNTQGILLQREKMASIGQLAAGIAHEINNPLGFVSSNFATLEKYFRALVEYMQGLENYCSKIVPGTAVFSPEDEENIRELKKKKSIDFIMSDLAGIFSESQSGLDRIANIVESMRSFSRADAENKFELFDLNGAIKNTLVIANNIIKNVVRVDLQLGEIPPIKGLAGEINQVLLNIIINSVQAIEELNRTLKGLIIIRTFPKENHVVCEIQDDGPGIQPSVINKIFDPFFTTKKIGKGTGLGLSISYDVIVNKHHGDLQVSSEPGKGSTFRIQIPFQDDPLQAKE